MMCVEGVCQSGCLSNNDCPSGTFMLCDSGMCLSTRTSLFLTTGFNGQSCYNAINSFNNMEFNAATTSCSGCPTDCANPPCAPWPIPSGNNCTSTTSDPPAGSSCGSAPCTNPDWVRNAQPLASAFKQACPAAYSFPFDDPTSTFQCLGSGSTSPLGYNITFCPSQQGLMEN